MALVTQTAGKAPEPFLMRMQQEIDECDRLGSFNAALPPTEGVGSWVSRVAAARWVSEQMRQQQVIYL